MLKKIKESLKNYFETKTWHFILLVASSVYVFISWNSIQSFDSLDANSLIFVIWIMLLLYPLFSEMEMFGIRLKRVVDEVKDRVEKIFMRIDKIDTIYADIQNAEFNQTQISSAVSKVDQDLQNMKDSISKIENSLPSNQFTCCTNPVINSDIIEKFNNESSVFFSTLDEESVHNYQKSFRYCHLDLDVCLIKHEIYTRLVSIIEKERFYNRCDSLFSMLEHLNKARIVPDDIASFATTLLNAIDYVTIHGWSVEKDYVDYHFILECSIVVLCKLDEILKECE